MTKVDAKSSVARGGEPAREPATKKRYTLAPSFHAASFPVSKGDTEILVHMRY